MDPDVHPYATLQYANTLAHAGRPFLVPAWQTYVIVREWSGQVADATGPYPLACLSPESDLGAGLETLRAAGFVSIVFVVDGLVGPSLECLREAFSLVRPFKTHYLVDPGVGPYRPSKHHRYEIRRAAQRGVTVRAVPLREILDEWTALYDELISRHQVDGIQRFDRASFEALARCGALTAVAAFVGPNLVSCHLWVVYKGFAWSHLAASSALGYASGAAYAVYDHSIRSFAGCVVNLGGSAGGEDSTADGLARFKEGFANRATTAYLVGDILDLATYQRLSSEHGGADRTHYFPAYRAPPRLAGFSLLALTSSPSGQ